MRDRKKAIVFLLTLIPLAIASCTKETDKLSKCKMVNVTIEGANAVTNITYNNDGKIATVITTGANPMNKVYTYFGNTIMIIGRDGGNNVVSRDSIIVDDKGRPLNIRTYGVNGDWDNIQLEYNGDDLARLLTSNNNSLTPAINTATYEDGNMVSHQTPTATFTFEYYKDQEVQPGDYFQVASFLSHGISIYPQKNLMKGALDGRGSISNFTYEFNDDGLITKCIASNGASTFTLTYRYECDQ
jgi:hypothetical protein